MATFKAEVYAHQKKADGTYNIKIRVTQNQKKRYLATTYYVTAKDLTRSLKIKNQYYIDACDAIIRKYRSICDQAGERLKTMTVDEVVKLLEGSQTERFDLDIVAYGRAVIKDLEETGHVGNARSYKAAVDNLVKFVGRESISVKEITAQFLKDWADWISKLPNVTRGYSQHNYLNRLRAIHNRAKMEFNDEDAGVIRIPNSPFQHIVMPKLPATRKRSISMEQLRAMAKLQYKLILQPGTNRYNFARDMFLLSFGLIGMNAVDLFNCTELKDGRITYQRTKTRNRREDKAEISVKIEPDLLPLVNKYRDTSGYRVFKFWKMYDNVNTFTYAINKGLKKIGKDIGVEDLEFYAARHTWATIALNDAGVDKYTVHTALNHVDDSMRVTDIYIRKSWEPNDKANRKVLDLLCMDMSNVEEPVKEKKHTDSICPSKLTILPEQNRVNKQFARAK